MMTIEEIETRILRLEWSTRELLKSASKFDELIRVGEEQIKQSEKLIEEIHEMRMDLET